MLKKLICLAILMILLLNFSSCGAQYQRFQTEFSGPFDTATFVIGYATSEAEFTEYAEIIYHRMNELHRLYDIFNSYEGINNIYTINQNAGIAPVEVNEDIISMLLLARMAYELSGGTVNVAMGSVLRVWHRYRIAGMAYEERAKLPAYEELREAAAITDINDLVIDEVNNTVFLRQAGMSLDVGSVAKGYAAGLAMKAAEEAGLVSALLNVGGHVITLGGPLGGARDYWSIGIQNPELGGELGEIVDAVSFNDSALSCSGGYQRFFVVDGLAYNHIINPETLMPADRFKQVAVIHENSALADILSTALFILPFEDGFRLAEEHGAEALWIELDGNWLATPGYVAISREMGE